MKKIVLESSRNKKRKNILVNLTVLPIKTKKTKKKNELNEDSNNANHLNFIDKNLSGKEKQSEKGTEHLYFDDNASEYASVKAEKKQKKDDMHKLKKKHGKHT